MNVAVMRNMWVVSDTTSPIINVDTITVSKISRVPGMDSVDVTFTADEAFVEYEVRRVADGSSSRASGSQVETATVTSRTSHTITMTDDEVIAASAVEGTNVFKVFVKDAAGNWST